MTKKSAGQVFAERIKAAMQAKGMRGTPSELAHLMKRSRQVCGKWLNGQVAAPYALDVVEIGQALNVGTAWLIGKSEQMTRHQVLSQRKQRAIALLDAFMPLENGKEWADRWIEDGYRTLNMLSAKPTAASPYPTAPTPLPIKK